MQNATQCGVRGIIVPQMKLNERHCVERFEKKESILKSIEQVVKSLGGRRYRILLFDKRFNDYRNGKLNYLGRVNEPKPGR